MLHQFKNVSESSKTHEVSIFVSSIETQKDVNAVKDALFGTKGVAGVLKFSCDKQSKLVTVKFSADENKHQFCQHLVDVLERKGFKCNEIREISTPESVTNTSSNSKTKFKH